MSGPSNIRSLSSRRSRSLFFGNMPETAFLIIWKPLLSREAFKRYKRATHFVGLLAHHVPIFNLFQASRVKRVLPVQNLIGLPSCDFDLTGIRHDHIVPAVDYRAVTFPDSRERKEDKHTTRVIDRLVFPHEHDCYSLGQFSKDTVFRVSSVPYACIGKGSLIKLSERIQYEYEGNIRCLLLGTSRLDCDRGRAGAGELAGRRHIYILSYHAEPFCVIGRHPVRNKLKPRPPPLITLSCSVSASLHIQSRYSDPSLPGRGSGFSICVPLAASGLEPLDRGL